MFRRLTRLFFLIMLGVSVSVLSADLPGQLSALQGRLEALKAKLEELQDALRDLNIKLEEAGKKEAINQLVKEKAFNSFMKKISVHLNDKGFIDNIEQAFKNNGYEAFHQIAQLFPKNQLNKELSQVYELFVKIYESFIDDDLTANKFFKADEKANKLLELEIHYNNSSLKKEKQEIIEKIVSNSAALTIEQLEKVSGKISSDSEKKLFINLVTKALTEKCLSQYDQEELVKNLMDSLLSTKPDEEISKIKYIIGTNGLVDFYKNGAKNLLMNGLKGATRKYLRQAKMMYKGVNIMPAKPAKRIFPKYKDFNHLVEKLEKGLKKPNLSKEKNNEIFEQLSVDDIPCEKLYEDFTPPAEHLRLLQEFLKNEKLLKPHENNKSLAQRLLEKIMGDVSSKDDEDWDTGDALVFKIPDWFNTIFKNDAIKKEALINIMTISLRGGIDTDDELNVFRIKLTKLSKLKQMIKDTLFGGDTNQKIINFCSYHDSKGKNAQELSIKIKNAHEAYEKVENQKTLEAGKSGGIANTGLMNTLRNVIKKMRDKTGYTD